MYDSEAILIVVNNFKHTQSVRHFRNQQLNIGSMSTVPKCEQPYQYQFQPKENISMQKPVPNKFRFRIQAVNISTFRFQTLTTTPIST